MDNLIAVVLGDVALVMLVSTVFSAAARRLRQPSVIGQILAGIALGPSVLGRLPGHLSSRLFPHTALPALTILAQVAIVVFMFVVGYEMDPRSLRRCARAVPMIAVSALFVPMGLGAGTALLFRSQLYGLGPHVSGQAFILFAGVAVSITALPVLAAIVRERGIAGTTAGVASMGAAGIMDVAAWLVLAVVLVSASHAPGRPWPVTLLLICLFAAAMILVVRPALRWWMTRSSSIFASKLPVAVILALGSAWVTASLGLHPVFGGFLAGIIMPSPDGNPEAEVLQPMEQVANMLLPLFFVVTGLSLNAGALSGTAWVALAVVCVIASAGKMVPAFLASRLGGLSKDDSVSVAVLVNTRGLTELIVLNVGLSAGIIGEQLFTVLVLMALVMTAATAPLLSLIKPGGAEPSLPPGAAASVPTRGEGTP